MAFEIAVIGADGLKRGGEEPAFHRSEHLLDVLGQVAGGSGIAAVETVRQRIILGYHLVRHAERVQDQRAGETGAILAGGAMNDQRRAVFKQMGKKRPETRRVVTHIVAVESRITSSASADESATPLAARARNAATTVGSIGSE